MKPTLPVQLNFAQKAKNGFEIQGKWPLNQLKRLNEVLQSDQGDVEVELKFDKQQHIPFITGHIRCELQLRCERCMQDMTYPIEHDFKLGLVQNEQQADRLPDEFEPYLVEDEQNFIADLLEDELLLALPLVVMHDYDCSEYLSQQADLKQAGVEPGKQHEAEPEETKENPFAALKDLLK